MLAPRLCEQRGSRVRQNPVDLGQARAAVGAGAECLADLLGSCEAIFSDRIAKAILGDTKTRTHHGAVIGGLSRPNPAFVTPNARPLIDRNPAAFWRGVSLILMLTILLGLWLRA